MVLYRSCDIQAVACTDYHTGIQRAALVSFFFFLFKSQRNMGMHENEYSWQH